MADTTTQNRSGQQNTSSSASSNQTSSQNTNQSAQSSQNAQSTASKNSWILPGLQQTLQRVEQQLSGATIQPYQYANLNDTEKAALQTLATARDATQLKQILSQYQSQAAGFTNYGQQQDTINQMAQKFYQSDLVNQNKQSLLSDINRDTGNKVGALNQSAIGSGNMASSRAGVAEGALQRSAQESYAKGAADIENSARNSAYSMAYQEYQQGQSNLNANLGNQSQLTGNILNMSKEDAQTAFTAGQQTQKDTQAQYDLNRKNQDIASNPTLAALERYLPALSGVAEFGVNSTGSQTGTSNQSGSTNGVTNTSGTQNESASGTSNTSGTSTGPATNWGELGAGLAGQAAGSFLQPVAQAAGNWLTNLF